MRLPRVRFSVRRMMVAVAAVGLTAAYTRFAIGRHYALVYADEPEPGTEMHPERFLKATAYFYSVYVGLPILCTLGLGGIVAGRDRGRTIGPPRLPIDPEANEPN